MFRWVKPRGQSHEHSLHEAQREDEMSKQTVLLQYSMYEQWRTAPVVPHFSFI